jgi:hypothetical protein
MKTNDPKTPDWELFHDSCPEFREIGEIGSYEFSG